MAASISVGEGVPWSSIEGMTEPAGEVDVELSAAAEVLDTWRAGRVAGCRKVRFERWRTAEGVPLVRAVAVEAGALVASAAGSAEREAMVALAGALETAASIEPAPVPANAPSVRAHAPEAERDGAASPALRALEVERALFAATGSLRAFVDAIADGELAFAVAARLSGSMGARSLEPVAARVARVVLGAVAAAHDVPPAIERAASVLDRLVSDAAVRALGARSTVALLTEAFDLALDAEERASTGEARALARAVACAALAASFAVDHDLERSASLRRPIAVRVWAEASDAIAYAQAATSPARVARAVRIAWPCEVWACASSWAPEAPRGGRAADGSVDVLDATRPEAWVQLAVTSGLVAHDHVVAVLKESIAAVERATGNVLAANSARRALRQLADLDVDADPTSTSGPFASVADRASEVLFELGRGVATRGHFEGGHARVASIALPVLRARLPDVGAVLAEHRSFSASSATTSRKAA